MKSIYSLLLTLAGLIPSLAWAHDGHGDTPWHAVLHMIEHDGGWILLLLIAAVFTLFRANKALQKSRSRLQASKGQHHDSR